MTHLKMANVSLDTRGAAFQFIFCFVVNYEQVVWMVSKLLGT